MERSTEKDAHKKQEIQELLTRGVENIFVRDSLEKKLLSGKKLKVYLGIDPTGPTLHIGHAIPILKLKQFQDLGHEVILLMGDFTAMIGDPTDKTSARKKLTHKEVLSNLKKYKQQAAKFLKFSGANKAQIKFNSKWLARMTFAQVLDLASYTTLDQIRKRDMFMQREKEGKPVFGHEFFYPLMQGYDSVAMDVDVEVGGNDQTFNMLMGRDLVSQMLKKDKSVVAMKLLADNSGKKMGKTEGNMISFLDSAEDVFGKVMSWNDSLILKGFELCTEVSMTDIEEYAKKLDGGANPKDIKLILAREMVRIFHNDQAALAAEENFTNTFSKGEIPEEMVELAAKSGEFLSEVLVKNNVLSSKGEWRRLVEGRGVHDLAGDSEIEDVDFKVSEDLTLKIGKKRFLKIKVN